MTLEVTLLRVSTPWSNNGKFLARSRYQVGGDTEALDSIAKFIADNASTFNAALTDQSLVAKLSNLTNLTITDLQCLRLVLANRGLGLWYAYVADSEVNSEDLSPDTLEYNVFDRDNIIGNFIPFCTKFIYSKSTDTRGSIYKKIMDSFGLFESSKFNGVKNPINPVLMSIQESEKIVGIAGENSYMYIMSCLEFLNKDLKVITE